MKLIEIKNLFAIGLILALSACSSSTTSTEYTASDASPSQEVQSEEAPEKQESKLGKYEGLQGKWTVDAATAGAQIDLTFNEDGSFAQKMGPVDFQNGTWTIVDDEHINIITPNTKAPNLRLSFGLNTTPEGQKWKVTELTESSVNLTWNLERKPMTLPMTRVTD